MSNFVVLSRKETEEAYRDLVRGKRPVQIAIQDQQIKQGTVEDRDKGQIFLKLPYVQRFEGTHAAVISFSLPPEVFFLRTEVTHSEGKYFFKEVEEVFRLQRRDTFRLNISDVGSAEVSFVGGNKYSIHDISLGGFSIELAAPEAKNIASDKQLLADLTIMGETFSNLLCEVKNTRIMPADHSRVLVGFQFAKIEAEVESELAKFITDVARKHFR